MVRQFRSVEPLALNQADLGIADGKQLLRPVYLDCLQTAVEMDRAIPINLPWTTLLTVYCILHRPATTMNTQDPSSTSTDPIEALEFVDRRDPSKQRKNTGLERRQFSDGYSNLSADAAELGRAVDKYKLENHRRFVTYEELLSVMKELGYTK